MRVVQRRLKQTEVMVWLTIVGILLGSVSVVAADWLTQRSELAVDAASTSSVRSRMALDVESMPSVETTRAKAIAKETSSTTADVARTTDAPPAGCHRALYHQATDHARHNQAAHN